MSDLPAALKKLMRSKGLTQEGLALYVGVSQPTISRYLGGCGPRRGQAFRKIEQALKSESDAVSEYSKTGSAQERIYSALQRVWDGSPKQADAISEVLEAIGKYADLKSEVGRGE